MFIPALYTLALAVCPTPPATGSAPPCIGVVVAGFVSDESCQSAARAIASAFRPAGGGQALGSCTAVPAPQEA
ncbi:hypothetical protein Sa4125_29720 [Aureimonas sp. SA4125]|nr:hypothetical protein Sa4125_29720 [Aureimonas sp. SA4125]